MLPHVLPRMHVYLGINASLSEHLIFAHSLKVEHAFSVKMQDSESRIVHDDQ